MRRKDVIDKEALARKYARKTKPGRIPFMKGRPKRDTVIGKDDIHNVLIALNTCESLDNFIKKM